jgi:hypothetical protein
MADISKLELTWEKVSWDLTGRINTDMSDIEGWGPLLYFTGNIGEPKVLVEFDDPKCKIQIKDIKVYTGTEFPPPDMKAKITEILIENYKVNVDRFKYLLLDSEYDLFAGRSTYHDPWYYLGKEDENWKILNFTNYCEWFDTFGRTTSGPDLLWRIGDQLFRTSNIYLSKPLGAIVLGDYCDRFVPKKDGEVKVVSLSGFATILMFLRKISGEHRAIHTSEIKRLYKDFEDAKTLPLVPVTWKDSDIELMNMYRLDMIINEMADKIETEKQEEEAAKKSQNNSAEDSTKDSEEMISGEKSTIKEMLDSAKDLVKKQITLAKSEPGVSNFAQNETKSLSKILSGQVMLRTDVWGSEFLVDIDTNITEGGISLAENEMLVAIISYGLLEILVDDTVQMDLCKELGEKIEEKYGIATQFLGPNDPEAKELLKRGANIDVTN